MPSTRTTDPVTTNGSRPRPSVSGQPIGSTARAAARNRSRIVLGVLVLVISALAAGLMYANLGDRRPVLAIARPVEAGQVIQAADLREVLAAPVAGVRTVAAASLSTMVGRVATVRLVPGGLLHPAQLSTETAVDADQAVVGAVLKPGQFPIGLRIGDEVLAVVLPVEAAPTADTDLGAPMTAEVVAIQRIATAGNALAVSLGVDPADSTVLATAGARGRLSLVLAPR